MPQASDPIPIKTPQQLMLFEGGVRLFNARDFRGARDRFRDAAAGPKRDIAHRAGQYLNMCEQRLRQRVFAAQRGSTGDLGDAHMPDARAATRQTSRTG
jgi:hypothetical protein